MADGGAGADFGAGGVEELVFAADVVFCEYGGGVVVVGDAGVSVGELGVAESTVDSSC